MGVLVNQHPHRPNTRLEQLNKTLELFQGKRSLRVALNVRQRISFYITFPKSGGVRIRGGNAGFFEPEALCDILYEEIDEHTLRLTGADTSVTLKHQENSWKIEIYGDDGLIRTVIEDDTLFYGFDKAEIYQSVYLELPIAEEERFFGFGERINHLEQKNIEITMWNSDCLSGMPLPSLQDDYCEKTQSYKNVPLVHSNKKYSIFFNTYYPIRFNIGDRNPYKLGAEIYGCQFDIYVWTNTTEENLRSYMELTGKPFLPPKWAFDYWMGGAWNVWNLPNDTYTLENITKILDQYEEMGIHIRQSYFEMNAEDEIFDMLKQRQVRPFMWTNSCLMPKWGGKADYTDYMVKKMSAPEQPMEFEYIDFTSPKSQDAICEKMSKVWDGGVKGMMIDFADNMPEDALCSNGKSGMEMHNGYAYWYAKRMNEAFQERMGEDFVLFQRSGCAGSQHYSGSFGGDMPETFAGLRYSVSEALSAAASGFSVWGSDLGGFCPVKGAKHDPLELYTRWLQFATFSPLMRCHGLQPHNPWVYGDTAKAYFQKYYAIRQSLLDKIYSTAIKTSLEGGTIMKSMAVAFEMSPAIESQYLFCDDLLVCPIVEEGKRETEVIIPEDGWTDVHTGEILLAGTYQVSAPLERIPIYVQAGTVMPVGVHNGKKALFASKPVKERSNIIYTSCDEKKVFCSYPADNGFTITASPECEYTVIFVAGNYRAESNTDSSVVSCSYHSETHVTEIHLLNNWEKVEIGR